MSYTFKITLAQLNPTVGDLNGNADKAFAAWEKSKQGGADLIALPEMFITGYNAQDLISKTAFHTAAIKTIQRLAKACADGPALAIGGPWKEGDSVFNAYFILQSGQIKSVVEKHHLPNDSVFDEVRIFDSGTVGGRGEAHIRTCMGRLPM